MNIKNEKVERLAEEQCDRRQLGDSGDLLSRKRR